MDNPVSKVVIVIGIIVLVSILLWHVKSSAADRLYWELVCTKSHLGSSLVIYNDNEQFAVCKQIDGTKRDLFLVGPPQKEPEKGE